MTERHDESAATGRQMSTGEFRAAPDISASTAQFQAFAENQAQPVQQWDMAAPARDPKRMMMLIAGGAVVLVIVVILIAVFA